MKERIFFLLTNNKKYIFVVISVILQKVMTLIIPLDYAISPVIDGVPIVESIIVLGKYTLIWFLPMFFIFNFFSGSLRDNFEGYGILLLVRDYKKNKIYIKTLAKISYKLLFIIIFQNLLYINFLGNISKYHVDLFVFMLIYFLMLLFLILLEQFLDFFLDSQISNLILAIYMIVSIMISNYMALNEINNAGLYFLIPIFSMARRNGMINKNLSLITPSYSIIMLLIFIFVLCFLTMKVFKRKNIYNF